MRHLLTRRVCVLFIFLSRASSRCPSITHSELLRLLVAGVLLASNEAEVWEFFSFPPSVLYFGGGDCEGAEGAAKDLARGRDEESRSSGEDTNWAPLRETWLPSMGGEEARSGLDFLE